jgi:RNA methyltransferase, TrmH family
MYTEISIKQRKFLKQLRTKKYRQRYGRFLAEGNKLVADLIKAGMTCDVVYIMDENDRTLFPDGKLITMEARKEFTGFDHPAGAAGVFELPASGKIEDVYKLDFIPALHAVQDPGNLGTIMRTAAWFGHTHILILEGTTDPFNPKSIQAGMGAVAHVQIVYVSEDELMQLQSAGFTLLGAEMKGESIYTFVWPQKSILILGNEGAGLRDFPLPVSPVSIPSGNRKRVESLNVAMAAGVLMSHYTGR